ncbi:MAG: hypothetical protein R6V85_04375 [Polyangia bacterium]
MLLSFFFAVALACAATRADEPDPPGELLDGIAVLVGSNRANEAEATPILFSQLELEIDLLLVRREGVGWRQAAVDEDLRLRARREAVLVRLLARQSRQMGEKVDPTELRRDLARLEEMAGGPEVIEDLLARHAATREDLEFWVEDALLAKQQILYMRERIDPPDEEELRRRFLSRGDGPRQQSFDRARRELRRTVIDEQLRGALVQWLNEVRERGLVRITN